MPLLIRRPGRHGCWILPSGQSLDNAPPLLMPNELRLLNGDDGWHRVDDRMDSLPWEALDLVVAMHAVSGQPDVEGRLDTLYRMLRPGRVALLVELDPWSPFRWRWRGWQMTPQPVWKVANLARRVGFTVQASYALDINTGKTAPGTLRRHDWRMPAWLPSCGYVLKLQRSVPGMTPLGVGLPRELATGASGA